MNILNFFVWLLICGKTSGHHNQETYWIGHGGTCETLYGFNQYCIHHSNCLYQNIDGQYKGRTELCGDNGVNRVFCCIEIVEEYPLIVDPSEEYKNLCEDKSDEYEDTNSDNLPIPQFKPRNHTQEQNVENRQPGNGGNSEMTQAQIADLSQVIRNVTINFPFYRPTPENSTSLQRCQSFYRTTPIPGQPPVYAFVGGRDAEARELPHMAALGYGNEDDIQWFCGGTLISQEYVLTAAHCLFARGLGNVKFIRLGVLDIRNATVEAGVQNFTVDSVIPHPFYKSRSRYHDIALIKLNSTAYYSPTVAPACLATTWDLRNIQLSASGWGLTEYLGEFATTLQTGILQYVDNQPCRNIYRTPPGLESGIIETLQICAGGGTERRDACQGDSGGPLQFTNKFYAFGQFPEIAGIVSHGIKCAVTAGVYTRVLPYVPWIEGIVWPN